MRSLTHITLIATAAAGSLLLTRCADTPQEQKAETDKKMEKVEDKMQDATADANTVAAWESERTDILKDLRSLRDDIDAKLASTNEKLADKKLKPSERKHLEAMKAELVREKANVEAQIKSVEGANTTTWETVKADTKKASDDVKSWWARLKENVDKETYSDSDHDGH